MIDIKVYFTEEFLNYLALSYGTSVSKLYLIQDAGDTSITNDMAIIGDDLVLTQKVEIEVKSEVTRNTFEWNAKIKKTDKKWKTKEPIFAGTFTNLYGGTSVDYLTNPNTSDQTEQALFVKENPTNDLTAAIFMGIFNTFTDYKIYPFTGTPTLTTDDYGTATYSYWATNTDFFSITAPDIFQPLLIGSGSTLSSFMYQSDTGLFLGSFSDIQVSVTNTQTLNGFFVTNESLIKDNNANLILFGCEIEGGLDFTHVPGKNAQGSQNYTIMKTPKISLSMDVVII